MPLEIRGAHFLIRSAQLVRGNTLRIGPDERVVKLTLQTLFLLLQQLLGIAGLLTLTAYNSIPFPLRPIVPIEH